MLRRGTGQEASRRIALTFSWCLLYPSCELGPREHEDSLFDWYLCVALNLFSLPHALLLTLQDVEMSRHPSFKSGPAQNLHQIPDDPKRAQAVTVSDDHLDVETKLNLALYKLGHWNCTYSYTTG